MAQITELAIEQVMILFLQYFSASLHHIHGVVDVSQSQYHKGPVHESKNGS